MRVVGGEFRGRPLAAPGGRNTRPTADRLRQTIFDILTHGYADAVKDARVLDLFAGTGALGIEALSRGAAYALFVEEAVEARGAIRANIESLGLTGRTRVFRRDATRLGPAGTVQPFALAFADPPYGKGLGETALGAAVSGGWLAPGALAVLEEAASATIDPVAGLDDHRHPPHWRHTDRVPAGRGRRHWLGDGWPLYGRRKASRGCRREREWRTIGRLGRRPVSRSPWGSPRPRSRQNRRNSRAMPQPSPSTTGCRSSSSPTTAPLSSPTWSGTALAPPTIRPANPASRISSNT